MHVGQAVFIWASIDVTAFPNETQSYQRPDVRCVSLSFLTPADPKLTARLINTARIAYGREPAYEHFAHHQPPFTTAITNIVLELPEVLERDRLSALAGETKEVRPLEWGGTDPSVRWRSGEVYETT